MGLPKGRNGASSSRSSSSAARVGRHPQTSGSCPGPRPSRPAPELAGLTEARRVEVAGPPGELQEAVKNAIAANGDQPILPPDGGSKDAELEAGVCTLDLRRDLEKGLAATQPEADSIAGRL